MLLIKNPAGANEAVRTLEEGGVPATARDRAQRRIADGRDVSWIWDVDFEPLLERASAIVVSGERAAELALRFKYAGVAARRGSRWSPTSSAALDRGLELAPPGGELGVLPTYTAMLELRRIAAARGLVRPYWEARREDRASPTSIPTTSTSTPTAATSRCSRAAPRCAGTSSR